METSMKLPDKAHIFAALALIIPVAIVTDTQLDMHRAMAAHPGQLQCGMPAVGALMAGLFFSIVFSCVALVIGLLAARRARRAGSTPRTGVVWLYGLLPLLALFMMVEIQRIPLV